MLSKEEKAAKKNMEEIDIETWQKVKQTCSKSFRETKYVSFFVHYKVIEKTLKFNYNEVNKKEFHASKQPITLNSVLIKKIYKFEHSGKGFKYFTGYKEDDIIRPSCIILPQLSGYIKFW